MNNWRVVEKKDHNAIHCLTWSKERAMQWIEEYGDSGIFMDKALTKESFEVVEIA